MQRGLLLGASLPVCTCHALSIAAPNNLQPESAANLLCCWRLQCTLLPSRSMTRQQTLMWLAAVYRQLYAYHPTHSLLAARSCSNSSLTPLGPAHWQARTSPALPQSCLVRAVTWSGWKMDSRASCSVLDSLIWKAAAFSSRYLILLVPAGERQGIVCLSVPACSGNDTRATPLLGCCSAPDPPCLVTLCTACSNERRLRVCPAVQAQSRCCTGLHDHGCHPLQAVLLQLQHPSAVNSMCMLIKHPCCCS